jgi:hypothetical protein
VPHAPVDKSHPVLWGVAGGLAGAWECRLGAGGRRAQGARLGRAGREALGAEGAEQRLRSLLLLRLDVGRGAGGLSREELEAVREGFAEGWGGEVGGEAARRLTLVAVAGAVVADGFATEEDTACGAEVSLEGDGAEAAVLELLAFRP